MNESEISSKKTKAQNSAFNVDELLAQAAEKKVSRVELTDEPKKPEKVSREWVHDGWSKVLAIFRPKPTISSIPSCVKSKYFRDPNSRQWVSVDQVQ